MDKWTPQTKSFVIIFSIVVVGFYLCLMLWIYTRPSTGNYLPTAGQNYQNNLAAALNPGLTSAAAQTPPPVDTSDWKTYTNSAYNFSFLYKPGWEVKTISQIQGFKLIQVDPGPKYYNIKIYISPSGFYEMAGLPAQTETINGVLALNVNNALYGLEASSTYLTFDVGFSMSLVPDFDALVHSVKFGQ